MNKRNGQYALAVVSFIVAGVLQYLGVDAVVLAAGASSIFAALAGYNTLNPHLSSEDDSHYALSRIDEEAYSCGLPDCCGNPDNCNQLGDVE
jgi:hypothetical protein